jgi:hypothetical protein
MFTDTIYPPVPEIPAFELLEQDYELYDPVRKGVEQEKKSAESQLAVLKATNLPKFEVGYRYQGILGQRFNGVHAGITLPLWEQQNKVEHQEAEVFYSELEIQEHLNEHFYEIRQLYDLQAAQASILQQYRDSFAGDSNLVLLEKALRLGEISVIEYFLETSFYYHTTVQYLETERDYHITLCNMFKYKL